MKHGYYVAARIGHLHAWLCGPFATRQQADAMLPVVRARCTMSDQSERRRNAAYFVKRKTAPLPPGVMKLDAEYVLTIIATSLRAVTHIDTGLDKCATKNC